MEFSFDQPSSHHEETYITVFSDNSLEYFPDNTNSSFRNLLYKPLITTGREMEAGLCEIFYTDKKVDEQQLEQDDQPSPTFFGHFPSDNIFLVYELRTQKSEYKKQADDMSSFITGLYTRMNNILKGAVKMSNYYAGNLAETNFSDIEFTDPTNKFQLSLSRNLADILGFKSTRLKKGHNRSELPQSQGALDKTSREEELLIIMQYYEQHDIKVTEPDNYLLEDLFIHINNALLDKEIDIQINIPPTKDKFIVNNSEGQYTIKFPSQINEALGLAPTFTFYKKRTELRLNPFPPAPGQPKPSNPILPQSLSAQDDDERMNSKIFVTTNLIEPTYFGSERSQVIRIFPRAIESNKEQSVRFSPVYYFSTLNQELSSIHTKLMDEKNQELPFTSNPTTAIYHIRPKQNRK